MRFQVGGDVAKANAILPWRQANAKERIVIHAQAIACGSSARRFNPLSFIKERKGGLGGCEVECVCAFPCEFTYAFHADWNTLNSGNTQTLRKDGVKRLLQSRSIAASAQFRF
jgi:hypothetical protein